MFRRYSPSRCQRFLFMPVVVVESPAKAKTINKYLGSDYTVLASYGHVRDLPSKDGSVNPDEGFDMTWEIATDSKKHVKAIADALKDDPDLILATDPDREGEAISWHLKEALEKRKAIKKDATVRRVTFNAITKDAVTQAMAEPRDVDMELVEAYLARRALDYLVGFTLSPVLWRKLPGAKSAGRVQSVALRIIVDREMEIEAFRPREYWSVRAILDTPRGKSSRPASWPWAARSSTATTWRPRPRRGWPSRPSPPARWPSRGWRPSPPRATPRRPS
jgi:DNA topoisomerase-1